MAEHSYDLVIVGAGSGNMLPTAEFADWRVAWWKQTGSVAPA